MREGRVAHDRHVMILRLGVLAKLSQRVLACRLQRDSNMGSRPRTVGQMAEIKTALTLLDSYFAALRIHTSWNAPLGFLCFFFWLEAMRRIEGIMLLFHTPAEWW